MSSLSKKYRANYYVQNREHIKAKTKLWQKENPEKYALAMKKCALMRRYRITLEKYNQMLEAQQYVCAICNNPEIAIDKRKGKLRDLAVDHNHETGRNRGLLCQACNHLLGLAKENPKILNAAVSYLEEHK